MRQHIGEFFGDRVGIDRHRNGAEHLCRHDGHIEPRPIAADDGHGVAAAQAEPGETGGVAARLLIDLAPGPGLPDAEVLVTDGRTLAELPGVAHQQFGKRVQCRIRPLGHAASSPRLAPCWRSFTGFGPPQSFDGQVRLLARSQDNRFHLGGIITSASLTDMEGQYRICAPVCYGRPSPYREGLIAAPHRPLVIPGAQSANPESRRRKTPTGTGFRIAVFHTASGMTA